MSKLCFLIVDDATLTRHLIKKTVREYFPSVALEEAINGRKAMSFLKHNRVDMVLCDWEMPEMNGAELLKWVRGEGGLVELPFVMITSRGDKEYVIKAVELGVNGYLAKPFNSQQLVSAVRKQLKRVGILDKAIAGGKVKTAEGSAFGSIEALTQKVTPVAPAVSPAKPKNKIKATVQLRYSDQRVRSLLKEIDLQGLVGVIRADAPYPSVLDLVVVDFQKVNSEEFVQINGFLHRVQSNDKRIDTEFLELEVCFVDQDKQKLEDLSKFISKSQVQ